jgi:hypothetical protein
MIGALALAMSASGAAYAGNLVVNPGFETGDNTGFTSDYTYNTNLVPAAYYFVDAESQTHNPNWPDNVGAHAGSYYMIVNGATGTATIWEEATITVVPNTTYYFSAWAASVYPESPAELNFAINGAQIGSGDFTPGSTVGDWQEFFVAWNSGSATNADIKIVDDNQAFSGNDFGLDDIGFGTDNPVPEPGTLGLLGAAILGLAGFAGHRKRRS